MSKFDILDDYNFGAPYLLHPKFVFEENCWVGFYSNLVYVVKISAQSKMLQRFGLHCSVKYEAFFTVARPFLDTRSFL